MLKNLDLGKQIPVVNCVGNVLSDLIDIVVDLQLFQLLPDFLPEDFFGLERDLRDSWKDFN